jgi:hypothetical protein
MVMRNKLLLTHNLKASKREWKLKPEEKVETWITLMEMKMKTKTKIRVRLGAATGMTGRTQTTLRNRDRHFKTFPKSKRKLKQTREKRRRRRARKRSKLYQEEIHLMEMMTMSAIASTQALESLKQAVLITTKRASTKSTSRIRTSLTLARPESET